MFMKFLEELNLISVMNNKMMSTDRLLLTLTALYSGVQDPAGVWIYFPICSMSGLANIMYLL